MEFYYFGGRFNDENSWEDPSYLERSHFSGVLFTYDSTQGDMLVRTAIDIDPKEKIKYLIAIRPHTISPQYLCAINDSISEISKDRLEINLITGYIKDHEKDVGGIVGDVHDTSSTVDRSNYMIDFLEQLNTMPKNKNPLDFYVSTTNNYVFEAAKKYKNKIILPYHIYRRKFWSDALNNSSAKIDLDINGTEIILAMTPIIRKTEEELNLLTNYSLKPENQKSSTSRVVDDVGYFTHETFHQFIQELEANGIHKLMLNAIPRQEVEVIIPFIKEYVESNK